jgi:hypothetical protein
MAIIRTNEDKRSTHRSSPTERTSEEGRAYLFISYAWEDAAFAEWLALKLTALGYAVWCDRFELLGGESYPRDIDRAIKERTFRVLGLLSHASIAKPNPVKERTLALNLGRERNIDFLIPLNLDGLKATELDWMESDLTFIPFHRSWHDGFSALLKKLEAIDAPRPLAGSTAVSEWFGARTRLASKAERLSSNLFEVRQLPGEIYWVAGIKDEAGIPLGWPAHWENDGAWLLEIPDSLAFDFVQPQPLDLNGLRPDDPTRRALANLLRQYLRRRCIDLGLVENTLGQLYFPHGLLPGDRLPFTHHTGRQASLQVVGFKTFRTGVKSIRNQHHLVVELVPRLDRFGPPVIELRVRVYVTDLGGNALPPKVANRRRKRIAKTWFNHQWWSRYAAVGRWFAQGNEIVDLAIASPPILISAEPVALPIGVGIDEPTNDDDHEDAEPAEFDEDPDADGEGEDQ